jgi:ABC-type branched-subunit amino acid transport system substrate-binding protein
LLAVGCGGSSRPTIALGAIIAQTGSGSVKGNEEIQAVVMAVDEINAAGGVLGSDLLVLNRDDRTDPIEAGKVAQQLSAMHVPAVLGAIGSAETQNALSVLVPQQIVEVSGSSTSPTLITPMNNGYFFRTCPSDALQGQLLAERAIVHGFHKVAIIHIPGAYGQGLSDVFAAHFASMGGTVTASIEYQQSQPSYQDVLVRVLDTQPEALLLAAFVTDGVQMIKDYDLYDPGSVLFMLFSDSMYSPSLITGAGGASMLSFPHEGTAQATSKTPQHATFTAAFKAKYDADSVINYSPNYYDAVYLIAAAIEAGQHADGPTIKAHLGPVSEGGMKFGPGQWQALRTAIHAGLDVDYDGASGEVDFDANGEVTAPYDVWKVGSDGTFQIVAGAVNP